MQRWRLYSIVSLFEAVDWQVLASVYPIWYRFEQRYVCLWTLHVRL